MRKGKSAFEQYTSESSLESKCLKYANKHGYDFIKLTGHIGDQDRILLGKAIAPFIQFVELKTKNEKLKTAQKIRRQYRLKQGYRVAVIDNFMDFKQLIDNLKLLAIE